MFAAVISLSFFPIVTGLALCVFLVSARLERVSLRARRFEALAVQRTDELRESETTIAAYRRALALQMPTNEKTARQRAS
jgi:hypothetical protein